MGAKRMRTSREQLNKAVSNVPDQQENEPGAHGERERALGEAAKLLEREADKLDGLVDSVSHHLRSKAKTIRALSSPDHSDAGKVEGDGWLPKAAELYDKCKLFPETSAEGFMALLQLRNHVAEIFPSAPSKEVAGS